MITQQRLKELFVYQVETGYLTKKVSGGVAGCKTPLGYWCIRIDGVLHQAHRLIWLYCLGNFPDIEIDHVNGNRLDNRIDNLRLATRSQNSMNTKDSKNNTSGKKGVSRSRKGWRGSIDANGKKYQKRFKTFEEAASWVDEKRIKLHGEFACFGGASVWRLPSLVKST